MTRMRDVLVELLGQERSAAEAAKPAPSTAPAGQPGSSTDAREESVRIVRRSPPHHHARVLRRHRTRPLSRSNRVQKGRYAVRRRSSRIRPGRLGPHHR